MTFIIIWAIGYPLAVLVGAHWWHRDFPNDSAMAAGGWGLIIALVWPFLAIAWLVGFFVREVTR